MFGLSGFESLPHVIACRKLPAPGLPKHAVPRIFTHLIPMKPLHMFVAIGLIGAPVLHAQQQLQLKMGDVNVKDPAVEVQKTPNFQAGDVKSKNVPNPRDWLEIEVEFEVKGPRDTVVKDLLFRYYVGFRDTTGSPRVLSGDVKHINVVTGESTYSVAYVPPSTLGEITGDFRRFQPNAVEAVGVEVYYNGVIVGGVSTKGGKFWESVSPQQNTVLGKADTPFALLWIDRYAEVDKGGR